nr:MAG TPA: hypothetical protein [Caudoviricetes sp.]
MSIQAWRKPFLILSNRFNIDFYDDLFQRF